MSDNDDLTITDEDLAKIARMKCPAVFVNDRDLDRLQIDRAAARRVGAVGVIRVQVSYLVPEGTYWVMDTRLEDS